ncbi:MAG: hypothetical protein ABR907_14605 [Terracidiphilus sp.]|jgi:hypothetical protein
MHGRLIAVTVLALNFSPFVALGQTPSNDDDAFIQKHQYDLVKVTWTRLDNYAASRVFAQPIYRVTIAAKEGYGQNPYWGNLVVTRMGDDIVPIPRPSRDGELLGLLALFRSDFRLNSDDVAETFQRALDLIYPTSQEDQWMEKFQHEGSQWTFTRGRYLNSPGGYWDFVVTVDGQGAVTAIRGVRRVSMP